MVVRARGALTVVAPLLLARVPLAADRRAVSDSAGRRVDLPAFDGSLSAVPRAYILHAPPLVAEVEARGGLVHHQDRGLLGERARDQSQASRGILPGHRADP